MLLHGAFRPIFYFLFSIMNLPNMFDNKTIIAILRKIITLLTLHHEDPVQIKHYTQMSFFLENTPKEVMELSQEERMQVPGMNHAIIIFLEELMQSGTAKLLEDLQAKTPIGVLEMLQVRGLGPSKVSTLWRTAEITDLAALKAACEYKVLEKLPGFGKKTQATILQNVLEQEQYKHLVHYKTALQFAITFETAFQAVFPKVPISTVGELRRKMEVIRSLQWLLAVQDIEIVTVRTWLQQYYCIEEAPSLSGPFAWRGFWKESILPIEFLFCQRQNFYQQLVLQTGSPAHLDRLVDSGETFGEFIYKMHNPTTEEEIYQAAQLPHIPPELREGLVEQSWLAAGAPSLLTLHDLKGILHVHTTFSDGQHTLADMAMCCKAIGYQYIGITDHSKTAVYARGLSPFKVYEQHQEIDLLNQQLVPFKILKGIESDILPDGRLDYTDEVLSQFDFVIISIHNGFDMTEKAATDRLIKAISHPYTTILGHLTGRLLLRRRGYPIDHHAVIDACAAYGVAIEINAHPWRLDLDWRWLPYALQKDVKISINPDAHSKGELHNMIYGVAVARKGGLTKNHTLNALSVAEITAFFAAAKRISM